MSRSIKPLVLVFAALCCGTGGAAAADKFPGVGRTATPAEVKAWDIDVRPDFKGLPKGSGNVDKGQEVWEARCASCHGTFAESNEVFTPIVGGTSKEDVKTGRVASLAKGDVPQRTSFMKVATLSTLFDYIQRAMPWNQPKSLTPDDVYGVLAYLLNLAEVVPNDFTLSDKNIRDVQKLMPNRNGMTTQHALWPGKGLGNGGKPDVQAKDCMKDCKVQGKLTSWLPDYAWNAHGNLADQNRIFGAVRGKVTGASSQGAAITDPMLKLATDSGCTACHGVNNKIVGPAYSDVASKYRGQADAEGKLVAKVKSGGQGVWGSIPMPPNANLKDADASSLVRWVLGLK